MFYWFFIPCRFKFVCLANLIPCSLYFLQVYASLIHHHLSRGKYTTLLPWCTCQKLNLSLFLILVNSCYKVCLFTGSLLCHCIHQLPFISRHHARMSAHLPEMSCLPVFCLLDTPAHRSGLDLPWRCAGCLHTCLSNQGSISLFFLFFFLNGVNVSVFLYIIFCSIVVFLMFFCCASNWLEKRFIFYSPGFYLFDSEL